MHGGRKDVRTAELCCFIGYNKKQAQHTSSKAVSKPVNNRIYSREVDHLSVIAAPLNHFHTTSDDSHDRDSVFSNTSKYVDRSDLSRKK